MKSAILFHYLGIAACLLAVAAPADAFDGVLLSEGRFEAGANAAKTGAAEAARAFVMCNQAEQLRGRGQSNEAQNVVAAALRILDGGNAAEDVNYARCLTIAGAIEIAANQQDAAESHLVRARMVYSRMPDAPGISAGTTHNQLAIVYINRGKYAEAEASARRAASLIRTAPGGTAHPALAAALNTLAQTLRLRSNDVEVEPLYTHALAILEKSCGASHPDYARTLGNLADYYRQRGRRTEAARLYRRAIPSLTASLGPEHPDVLLQKKRLAAVTGERRPVVTGNALR